MKIRKRPADAVVGNRQLSARVLGLPYDRFWVETRTSASKPFAHDAVANEAISARP